MTGKADLLSHPQSLPSPSFSLLLVGNSRNRATMVVVVLFPFARPVHSNLSEAVAVKADRKSGMRTCDSLLHPLGRFHLHNLPLPVWPLENKAHNFQFLLGGYRDGGVFRVPVGRLFL